LTRAFGGTAQWCATRLGAVSGVLVGGANSGVRAGQRTRPGTGRI